MRRSDLSNFLTAKEAKKDAKERKVITEITENILGNQVIGLALQVHTALGPGLLESAYKECLFYKLIQSKSPVEKEKRMPLIFEEVKLDCGYRIDLLVNNNLVVEIKSIEALH